MRAVSGAEAALFSLEPETAAERAGNQLVAPAGDAWLRVTPVRPLIRRRWVCLRYSASYFDDPVRPMIRFDTARGQQFLQFMNGPVLGSGEWIGRIPDRTVTVSISPVASPGEFDFRLASVERVARTALVRRGFGYDRNALLLSLGAKIVNAEEERWDTLKFAASATPFKDYAEWHRRLYRPFDIEDLDRPRSDWRTTPAIRLIMRLGQSNHRALKDTISSLRAQIFGNWSLHAISSSQMPHDLLSAFRSEMAQDSRLYEIAGDSGFSDIARDFGAQDGIAIVEAGNSLPNYALAVLAEKFAQEPGIQIAYGDEDSITAMGVLHSPLFKPDWSPVFFDGLPYLGRLTCIRTSLLSSLGIHKIDEFISNENALLKQAVKSRRADEICHIRRILYRRRRERGQTPCDFAMSAPAILAGQGDEPEATIVIPTRDRADLLAQCLKSLHELTDYPRYHVIVVDNGSSKRDAVALLRDLSTKPRHTVLEQPGTFNFSRLCNAGAHAAATPLLIFLNNDVVLIDRNWLTALADWAMRPDVGIVGAKLLFPDNTIEHAGVVLGHGSLAGHIYHRQLAGERGYMNQLQAAREVEAVTGACIAIERAKFDALGGFEETLAVEFNDIDLCLKAAERGWSTIWTPKAVLYHLQSASRGYPIKPYKVFRKERDYFLKRWAHLIRDDRFFHPALSLYSHKPALA